MFGFGLRYEYGRIISVGTKEHTYQSSISTIEEGNDRIREVLKKGTPALIARIGATELNTILFYLHNKWKLKINWPESMVLEIWQQSGIFSKTNNSLSNFAKQYLDAIAMTDVMGVWYNTGEDSIINKYCPNAQLIPLKSIEPYFFKNPWSKVLKDKKVCVIHPFEDSINEQYFKNRENLFFDKDVLPPFHLINIKTIQAQVFTETSFQSWEEILDDLKTRISKSDFDIAIIGAGGYGLLIGAYIKSIGKIAIHMGGATQILFGIKGKRWEDLPEFNELFNEKWKYPFESEKPANFKKLEDGAYW